MARTPFVCGNWKMFTDTRSGTALAKAVATGVIDDAVKVAVCPPYPYLAMIARDLEGSRVALGAQNLYPAKEGAFTGEVSPAMLKDIGCEYVIVGHSERRHGLGEQNAFVDQKVLAGLEAGLKVIFCVGETLAERQKSQTEAIIYDQLVNGLKGMRPDQLDSLTIAYEPVWAIGTGHNATPEQAQAVHAFIRGLAVKYAGTQAAERLVIVYGGSMKPENAGDLMAQPDVDGGLIGGASLKAESFLAIVNAARTTAI